MTRAKLPISGLKLSPRLALINLFSADKAVSLGLYRSLTERRLNVPFATLQMHRNQWRACCCIAEQALEQIQPLLAGYGDTVEVIDSVATLTVFPHRSRLDLLSRLLAVFATSGLPLYALGSSLSTIIGVTAYDRVGDAVAAIESIAQLPENHAPFKTEISVRQI